METITKSCEYCNNSFTTLLKYHKRGNAKFCSKSCSSKNRNQKEHNVKCEVCEVEFYRNPNRIKRTKSNYIFCSNSCKNEAAKIENHHKFPKMIPSHYKTTKTKYRDICFRDRPRICEDCGYDKHPEIIQVHHIDLNRRNNRSENLKALCPNCHETVHYLTKTGKHSPKNLPTSH